MAADALEILGADRFLKFCAAAVDHQGNIKGLAQKEFKQIYPQPGWVEHDANEIWSTQFGTIAEAMAHANTDASLVLMPLGTANDFAKAAGVPLEPAGALALLDVQPRAIDLGQVGGQIFLNMATGGFGSQVTANTSEDLKKVYQGLSTRLVVEKKEDAEDEGHGHGHSHGPGGHSRPPSSSLAPVPMDRDLALSSYNLPFLDVGMVVCSTVAIVAYLMYCFSPEVTGRIGNKIYFTAFFVIIGILRYLQLTLVYNKTESPTRALLRDGFLQIVLLAWIGSFAWMLYMKKWLG